MMFTEEASHHSEKSVLPERHFDCRSLTVPRSLGLDFQRWYSNSHMCIYAFGLKFLELGVCVFLLLALPATSTDDSCLVSLHRAAVSSPQQQRGQWLLAHLLFGASFNRAVSEGCVVFWKFGWKYCYKTSDEWISQSAELNVTILWMNKKLVIAMVVVFEVYFALYLCLNLILLRKERSYVKITAFHSTESFQKSFRSLSQILLYLWYFIPGKTTEVSLGSSMWAFTCTVPHCMTFLAHKIKTGTFLLLQVLAAKAADAN